MVAMSSRSLLLFEAGSVGEVSAALITSFPLIVLIARELSGNRAEELITGYV
jgi:hypothetical protein